MVFDIICKKNINSLANSCFMVFYIHFKQLTKYTHHVQYVQRKSMYFFSVKKVNILIDRPI